MMAPIAYLPNGQQCDGEGYVFHSETYGSVKLVNRTVSLPTQTSIMGTAHNYSPSNVHHSIDTTI